LEEMPHKVSDLEIGPYCSAASFKAVSPFGPVSSMLKLIEEANNNGKQQMSESRRRFIFIPWKFVLILIQ
jgi:hypothetical protein